MRILHVITRLELGGAQQNTLHTCRRLAELGHEVTLASGSGGRLDAEARSAPYRFVGIPSLVREIRPFADARALVEVTRLVRSVRPDVVHTHSSKAGALGRAAASLARAPVVIHSVHGWSFAQGQSEWRRRAYGLIERACAPLTTAFIFVSREDLDLGVRTGLVRAERARLVRSGIDLDEFTPSGPGREEIRREWGVGDEDVLVVNVSNFKPQKAPLDFVRAAGIAAREEGSLRFAYVGDGELRPAVEAAIDSEGLRDRMTLAGWRDDVACILRASDVVALTSRWEGLPRTVVQARAVGRPVVAARVNGVPEAIVDGVHGVLLEAGDVDGFAAAFVQLARDPGLRQRLGSGSRAGLEEFDQDAMVAAQLELYERLAVARPGSVRARAGPSPGSDR